ncbi:MAG: ShlB/FhaC/HecB family hemolysin secretion/activation protein [Steroidobacteraceae bacterium]
MDLALQVNDHLPLHGSLELNNQATIDTDSLRMVANLSYGDLFGRLDNISGQYQFTPQDPEQVRVIALNYAAHAFDSGLQPSLLYINSNSNVPAAGTLGVLGIGEITGIRLGYALPNTPSSVQAVTFGIDYKHFRNTINQNDMTAFNTPITYMNLSLTYAGAWHTERFAASFNTTANAGPRGLVNRSAAFENDRYLGRANYFDLRADLALSAKLPADFLLKFRAAGQAAAEPLITNEDYSVAGSDGVRGYLESEELGDKAIKGTLQLDSPGLRVKERLLGDVYVFFDAGKTVVIDPLPGEPAGADLSSYGVGFDLLPGERLSGALTWARAQRAASVTHAGDSRVLFVVRGSF